MSEDSQFQNLSDWAAALSPAWAALFEAIEDGVCNQSLDSRIVRANSAFADMNGLPLKQLLGRNSADVIGWSAETDNRRALMTGGLSGEATSEELDGLRAGQRLRARFSSVRDEQGSITAHVMVVRDITDTIAHEREIARVEQRARFGELAAGLAHEI